MASFDAMSDEAAFLSAIRASPRDRSLRLIYADWLEDQGDQRCEFLRADCELQQLIAAPAIDERKLRACRAKLKKLAAVLDAEWVALFESLRPAIIRCRTCKKVLSPQEAIDIHPRNYTRMKTTRYCRLCYEDAVRSAVHRQSQAFDEQSRFRVEQIEDE